MATIEFVFNSILQIKIGSKAFVQFDYKKYDHGC